MPIIERPAVSNVMVLATLTPVAFAASSAAATSSFDDIVSIHSISTPPATSASACSRNAATALSCVKAPSGSNNSPVGPIDPATMIVRPVLAPCASATTRATLAAAIFNSVTRSWASCNFSRKDVPPNELVRMRSDPASRKLLCSHKISSGRSTFHNSGG